MFGTGSGIYQTSTSQHVYPKLRTIFPAASVYSSWRFRVFQARCVYFAAASGRRPSSGLRAFVPFIGALHSIVDDLSAQKRLLQIKLMEVHGGRMGITR